MQTVATKKNAIRPKVVRRPIRFSVGGSVGEDVFKRLLLLLDAVEQNRIRLGFGPSFGSLGSCPMQAKCETGLAHDFQLKALVS